jgi:hypothetical protein
MPSSAVFARPPRVWLPVWVNCFFATETVRKVWFQKVSFCSCFPLQQSLQAWSKQTLFGLVQLSHQAREFLARQTGLWGLVNPSYRLACRSARCCSLNSLDHGNAKWLLRLSAKCVGCRRIEGWLLCESAAVLSACCSLSSSSGWAFKPAYSNRFLRSVKLTLEFPRV